MHAPSATEDGTEAGDWSQLPRPAITNLMLQAGQSARHGRNSLALVCSSWAEAVDAVSAQLKDLEVYRCANIVSLQCWMAKYGQQLQTLRLLSVADSMGLVLQLCPHLQHLSLHSCDVDVTLCSRANLFNSISTATALSSLHINKCRLLVSRGSRTAAETAMAQVLSALAPLTALQELSVCGVGACASAPNTFPDAPSAHLLLPTAFLQPLQHLTQLHLQAKHKKEGGVLQHISSMTDLQDLRLGGVNGAPLQLAVTHLTALTKLRRLGLRGVSLECRSAVKSAANIAALLAWLPMLQGLSSLQLRAVAGLCAWGRPEHWRHFPAATAYSALTAGSALQHIDLRSTEFSQGACEHAFPLEGTLTNITSLRFGPHYDDACLPLDDYLRCAVASCPNLRELQSCESNERQPLLSYHTAAMSGWSLQQRTSLTRLTMHVCHAEWGEQLELLGMLTQLKSLQLVGMDVHTLQETVDALWPLISLTWLSCLSLGVRLAHPHREGQDFLSVVRMGVVFDRVAATAELLQEGGCDSYTARATWTFVSKAPPGSPPDVWSQLQTALDRAAGLGADSKARNAESFCVF